MRQTIRSISGVIALKIFLPWYFLEKPVEIVNSYTRYCGALNEVFSFRFLIKTLFAPWKGIVDDYPAHGFNLTVYSETFALNMMTRTIGCIFRIVLFALGIAVQCLCLILFSCWLLIWMIFPFIALYGVSFLIRSI